MRSRCAVTWEDAGHRFTALEPAPEELAQHAATLAAWYNEPHNRELMSNTTELSVSDVVDTWAELREAGGRAFLLFLDDVLVGDADLRGLTDHHGEFAIMVGPRTQQGLGLGTRFSLLVHHVAFTVLGLREVFLTIVPQNLGGRRCYEKVGYLEDASAAARAFAENATDVAMSLPAERFAVRHGAVLPAFRVTSRS